MWKISEYSLVNFTFTMQMMVLPVSFVAIVLLYLYDRKSCKAFFRLGELRSWASAGLMLALVFTLGNAALMAMSVNTQYGIMNHSFYSLLPFVLFFAATNAWSEEIFSRFVIVAGLRGKLSHDTICWISAIIFGLPHFFGTPSGFFGVIASGVLGWFLAKSVIETKGLGWAWFIHFLQDVVIFGAGAMILVGQNQG